MKLIISFVLLNLCFATNLKVVTFNTMCDWCSKEGFASYEKRVHYQKKILMAENPDIMALQEVRTSAQLLALAPTSKFHVIYKSFSWLDYPDPALALKKDRFEILETKHYWLGPRLGNFSFGWNFSLPRGLLLVKVRDQQNDYQFFIATSHFDNLKVNMNESAKFLISKISNLNLPVLFLADTNSKPHYESYKTLMIGFEDSFHTHKKSYDEEGCYRHKGSEFPTCRVDHVLYTQGFKYKPKTWKLDLTKLGDGSFPSDHRPVVVEFAFEPIDVL